MRHLKKLVAALATVAALLDVAAANAPAKVFGALAVHCLLHPEIRTYNFPQGRVTDHRINLTLYKLEKVIAGEALDELVDALITEHQAAQLAAMEGVN